MWTMFALIFGLSLAPGQAAPLALTNVRTTYGITGITRTDTKFVPGDNFVLSFDIEGIKADDSGKVLYSVGMEIADGKGMVLFKQTPRDLEASLSLGGNKIQGFANLHIGLNQQPGDYTVKVTVTDRASKASKSVTGSYQVLPANFSLVRLTTTSDPEGRFPAPFVGEGQSLWINFSAVGFGRASAQGQPNLTVTMTVLDENGRPTAKPFVGEVNKDVPQNAPAIPLQFLLELNRAGKFTVQLKATDNASRKIANLSFPLTVLKPR
jgi:hypothetical protein